MTIYQHVLIFFLKKSGCMGWEKSGCMGWEKTMEFSVSVSVLFCIAKVYGHLTKCTCPVVQMY